MYKFTSDPVQDVSVKQPPQKNLNNINYMY